MKKTTHERKWKRGRKRKKRKREAGRGGTEDEKKDVSEGSEFADGIQAPLISIHWHRLDLSASDVGYSLTSQTKPSEQIHVR